MAKRLSGGRRATLRKQGEPPGKPGCPKGTVTSKVAELRQQLFADLIHELWRHEHRERPKVWRPAQRSVFLGISTDELVVELRKRWPERYGEVRPRTLRRHVDFIRAHTAEGPILWPRVFRPK